MIISICLLFLTCALLYLSIYDFYYNIIPNYLSTFIIFLGVTYNYLLNSNLGLLNSFFGLLTGLTVTLVLYRLTKIGAGDIKLYTAIGSFVGSKMILIIIAYSYVISAILGFFFIKLWLNWYKNKIKEPLYSKPRTWLKQRIPMAPGISLATLYVLYSTPF